MIKKEQILNAPNTAIPMGSQEPDFGAGDGDIPPQKTVRSTCSLSRYKHHIWVPDTKLTRKTNSGVQWFFHCKLCQVVKFKVMTVQALEGGKWRAHIKEVFPSGQIVDEQNETRLSGQETYEMKDNGRVQK